MFNSGEWDDDELFKGHTHWTPPNLDNHNWEAGGGGTMDVVITIACVIGIVVLLILMCRCCCGTRYRGRVLQPAPDPNSTAPAAAAGYPQQQYTTATVPVIHSTARAPYPGGATYPTVGAPYPGAGGPYPGAGAPYPSGGAPYPAAGAPYPVVAPYPAGPYPAAMPQPQSSTVPTAPDAHAFLGIMTTVPAPPGWHTQALPPSYDQVMSNEAKSSPFNPYAPH